MLVVMEFAFTSLVIVLSLAAMGFWIWMLIDCATHEKNKLFWFLIILWTHFIGALIYFFVRRQVRL
jgi:hypothetical protein